MPGTYENPIPQSEKLQQIDALTQELNATYASNGFPVSVEAGGGFDDEGVFVQHTTRIWIGDKRLFDAENYDVGLAEEFSQEDMDALVADLKTRYPLAF